MLQGVFKLGLERRQHIDRICRCHDDEREEDEEDEEGDLLHKREGTIRAKVFPDDVRRWVRFGARELIR